MPLNWTTTSRSGVAHGVKCMTYGPSGSGKTRLAATAPNPLILSAEAGLLSLRKFDIPVLVINNVDDLTDAHRFITTSSEAKRFDSVAVDSITEIGEVILANAKRLVKDPRQAYGELIDKVAMVIRAFRDLPGKHVYISAKQEYIKDAMTGVLKYGPSMPGSKLGPALPYFFDEVFRLGRAKAGDGTEYDFLQTRSDLQYEAKDRSGSLDHLEPPDLSHIFRKIQGG